MRRAESQNFHFRWWFLLRRAGTYIVWEILKLIASEDNRDGLWHAWCNRSLFVGFYGEARFLGLQNRNALGNGGSIDDFYSGGVGAIELIPCKLELRRVDLDEGVARRFLKFI